MQKSSKKLNPKIKKAIFESLYQVVADLKNKKETRAFLKDFLSEIEKEAIAKRLAIVLFLKRGMSYDEIKDKLKVSSTTIATLKEQLSKNNKGLKIAFKKIEAEEWADKWNKRLKKIFS